MKTVVTLAVIAFLLSSCMRVNVGVQVKYRFTGGHFTYDYVTASGEVKTGESYRELITEPEIFNPGDHLVSQIVDVQGSGAAMFIYLDGEEWKQVGADMPLQTYTIDDKIPLMW